MTRILDRIGIQKHTKALFTALVGVIAVIIGFSFFYISALRNSMMKETKQYLTEVSNHISTMINSRVRNTYQTLEFTGKTCAGFEDAEMVKDYLTKVQEQYGFKRIGIASLEGNFFHTDGYYYDNEIKDLVESAKQSKSVVSGVRRAGAGQNENVLIYAVPVLSQGNITGILAASISLEQLSEFLNVESFGQQGYSFIVDIEGNYIIRSTNENARSTAKADNIYTFLDQAGNAYDNNSLVQMKKTLKAGGTGIIYYTASGIKNALTYMPLEETGWYLLSIVPTNVAGGQITGSIQLAVLINSAVCVLFIILIVIIVVMQRQNNKKMEEIIFKDSVTGGFSRYCFEMNADRVLKKSTPSEYALVSMDIQKFKLINDLFGSEMGDKTLKYVYHVLEGHLQEGEMLSRISADTFNLLLKNSSQQEMVFRLEQMVEDINSFNDNKEQKYYLPVSFGVYVIGDLGLNLITIQDRANVARKTKDKGFVGKLSYCVFYKDIERERMVREKQIDNDLARALENREFLVYLQPKVCLKDNQIRGAEALVRWKHPVKGMIPPGEFIPVLEANGFVVEVDLYIFEEVCRLIKRWLDRGLEPVPISVNLSRIHLNNPNFFNSYREIFERYEIPAKFIEIELTETVVFEKLDIFKNLVDEIHQVGFQCSMDDFGSGYSSLNLLKDISVDVLKLDSAFFGRGWGVRGEYVIECILELADKLQMTTVAEGVEVMSQVEFLKKAKCDMVQGYVYYRPMPEEEFEQVMFHLD